MLSESFLFVRIVFVIFKKNLMCLCYYWRGGELMVVCGCDICLLLDCSVCILQFIRCFCFLALV